MVLNTLRAEESNLNAFNFLQTFGTFIFACLEFYVQLVPWPRERFVCTVFISLDCNSVPVLLFFLFPEDFRTTFS